MTARQKTSARDCRKTSSDPSATAIDIASRSVWPVSMVGNHFGTRLALSKGRDRRTDEDRRRQGRTNRHGSEDC